MQKSVENARVRIKTVYVKMENTKFRDYVAGRWTHGLTMAITGGRIRVIATPGVIVLVAASLRRATGKTIAGMQRKKTILVIIG